MFDVIRHRNIFFAISGLLVLASIAALAIFGLKPGIDFTGGTLWQIKVQDASESAISDFVAAQGFEAPTVFKETSSDSYLVKLKPLSEADHQKLNAAVKGKFGSVEELRFESIGPTVGAQLRSKAITAAILVLLAISIYIAISFRKVSHPVASWKYGMMTLASLFHDAIIPLGVLAVLGHYQGIELDTNFVVAILFIIGFSVHDTIVVFDRIRENLLTRKSQKSFGETVNESIWQTIARSINTSFTLVLVLVAMIILGATNLRLFIAIVLIGTIIGTYSSVFLASPLLTISYKSSKNK
jgi:preprotein translocase subunit SecF